jgi:type I restriction enzyme S subunit
MTGGTPSKAKPEYFGGEIRWLVSGDIHQGEIFDCEGRISDAGMKNSNAKLLPINSVMIALNGQGKTRGTVALLRMRATCNQSLVSIYPNDPDMLLPEFLYANLHGRYQEIRQMTGDSGNDRRGLNMGLIESIEIPIAPLPEQRRIGSILDEAFEGMTTAAANAEKNLQNARAIFESHLQSVFTQRGPGWVETKLGEAYDVRDGTHDSPKYHATGYPLITSKNLKRDGLTFDDVKLISEQDYTKINERSAVHKGDVLFAMIGTIGNPTLVEVEPNFAIKNVALFKNPNGQSGAFLKHYLDSGMVISKMMKEAKGTTQKFVGLGYLRGFPINLPPLTTQLKLVEELNELSEETQRLAHLYERKRAALEALKKSLLRQAFSGAL